ncbi:hypothetical protein JOD54_005198 [Actinokineospora baliensis]|nr:hypothetical protein [Actinokineospora baliensis]MBM7774994.1 hypothetical protein [Actinokineospora baliensis]
MLAKFADHEAARRIESLSLVRLGTPGPYSDHPPRSAPARDGLGGCGTAR